MTTGGDDPTNDDDDDTRNNGYETTCRTQLGLLASPTKHVLTPEKRKTTTQSWNECLLGHLFVHRDGWTLRMEHRKSTPSKLSSSGTIGTIEGVDLLC